MAHVSSNRDRVRNGHGALGIVLWPLDWFLPGPPKYVKELPFWLFLVTLGYDFTYFWGPGI